MSDDAGGARILVVEDDAASREAVTAILSLKGYRVVPVGTAEAAVESARRDAPDLVLLDLRLGAADGFDVLSQIRSFQDVPVIILSGKITPEEKALGLRMGADDYVGKPFDAGELLARIEARLRPARTRRIVEIGPVRMDLSRREAFVGENRVDLTNRQFDVLALLASDPGRAFSRDEILREVWGTEYVTKRNVNEQVRLLRARLGMHGIGADIIETAPGLGYRIADPDKPRSAEVEAAGEEDPGD